MRWTKTKSGNEVLDEGEYLFISYRSNTREPFEIFSPLLANILQGDSQEETVMYFMDKWYILNGDFRKEYEEVFPDPVACFKVFERHKDKISTWSSDYNIEDFTKARLKNALG